MQNINSKTIALSVGGILLTIVLLFGAWKLASRPQTQEKFEIKVLAADHSKGKKDAKVVLVEYSDFQCPACKAYHPVVKTITEKYKDQILFVYRHFPLASHKNGPRAAQAAEAASIQGKFWEMHDLLFKNQDNWASSGNPTDIFVGYAKELKLDLEKFKKEIDSAEVKTKVNTDRDSGVTFHVDSTPSFFLNGVKLSPPGSLAEFESLIQQEIKASEK